MDNCLAKANDGIDILCPPPAKAGGNSGGNSKAGGNSKKYNLLNWNVALAHSIKKYGNQ
ncbi:MAG: hypothetical protein LC111_03620 [Bacteroidia bacterium]|nr:hypothetical protein [Bacteroidia bacterium]